MLAVVDELKRARDQMDMGMANRLWSAPCAAMTFCSKMGMITEVTRGDEHSIRNVNLLSSQLLKREV
jgi:hypothetical protein